MSFRVITASTQILKYIKSFRALIGIFLNSLESYGFHQWWNVKTEQ